jgi:DNA repair exonuclease SbcCD nuclease subunit
MSCASNSEQGRNSVPFTFVHAADLHLASPFQGLAMADGENQSVVEHLRNATFLAFERLVELCMERKAAFLLLAGDLFDDEECSVRDLFRFRDGLARLEQAGIEVFAIYGNHDPFDGTRPRIDLPANTHVFGCEEICTVPVAGLNGVTVTGISYRTNRETRKLAGHYTRPPEPGFHIGLLHADVGGNASGNLYAACSVEQLRDAGFNYWALGHIHERRTFCTEPFIAYSGNIQGRNPKETGERGALVVTADVVGGKASAEFVPLQEVRWEQVEVSISGIGALDALEERLLEELGDVAATCQPSSLVARLRLTGRGPLNGDLRAEDAADHLRERLQAAQPSGKRFVWIESLRLECGSEIDFASRREGDDLAAEVLKQAELRATDGEWLEAALADLFGHRRAKKVLSGLPDDVRSQLLREAAEQCVEELDGEA